VSKATLNGPATGLHIGWIHPVANCWLQRRVALTIFGRRLRRFALVLPRPDSLQVRLP
jgi:hypothetical protein